MRVTIKDRYIELETTSGYGREMLLPQEIDRLIVELRRAANTVYAARIKPKVFWT